MEQMEARTVETTIGGPAKRGIDAFWLKVFAITGMTLDHIGVVFGAYLPLWAESALYALGGLTFPIMAFLLCEGYRHTRNLRNYALRLLVFALVTQLPYMWALMSQLNVLFTLLLGLLALICIERIKSPALCTLVMVAFTALSVFCDWGMMGVPMVLLYFYTKDKKLKPVLPLIMPLAMMGINYVLMLFYGQWEVLPQLLFVVVGCGLTVPLLSRYNGRRGRYSMKYFFYAYYPLHIVVLGLLRGLLTGDWGSWF